MECERLQKLVKRWYLQVQAEEMGPARMVDFMNSHVIDCLTCMADPAVDFEIKRITKIVLPQEKIPKAVRKESSANSDKANPEKPSAEKVEDDKDEVENHVVADDQYDQDNSDDDDLENDEI